MISFRFHLVSLVAVFVAIALGIAVGATVVDRATVELLERQVKEVDARLDRTDAENTRLRAGLTGWEQFAEEAGDRFAVGRLQGVEVVLIAVRGSDTTEDAVTALRSTLEVAEASVVGTIWVRDRFRLTEDDDVTDLAAAAGVSEGDAESTRQAAITQLADGLVGTTALLTAPLQAAGFLDIEAPNGVTELVVAPTARFVVVSGVDADVPNPEVAVPLVAELVRAGGKRVVAAEPGRDATANDRAVRADFVGLLRRGATEQMVSTVDNLEDRRGRLATVLALADLTAERIGHYGVGPKASRLLPAAPPAP